MFKKLCKNCRDWEVTEVDSTGRLRECVSPKAKKGYAWMHSKIKDDEVVVENDEGWGRLMGGEYGCVHWKKKESKNVTQER